MGTESGQLFGTVLNKCMVHEAQFEHHHSSCYTAVQCCMAQCVAHYNATAVIKRHTFQRWHNTENGK